MLVRGEWRNIVVDSENTRWLDFGAHELF